MERPKYRYKTCPMRGCKNTCDKYALRCSECALKERRKFMKAKEKKKKKPPPERYDVEEKASGKVSVRALTHIDNIPDLLEHTKVDRSRFVIVKQSVSSYQSPNTEGTRQLFRIAVELKPIVTETVFDGLERAAASINVLDAPKKHPQPSSARHSRFAAEWAPYDHHFGNLAWGRETGEDYDLNIAKDRFITAAEDAVHKATRWDARQWVIPLGQDYAHVDGPHLMTSSLKPKNPPLEVDGRWQKVFETAVTSFVTVIEMMRQAGGTVYIPWVPGNHDLFTSWWMAYLIAERYRDCADVVVDRSPSPRKYWEFGTVLIGYTHGDKEKQNRLPGIMAHHNREAWARTTTHEWHIGHIHTHTVRDYDGVMVRSLPSLTGSDAWSHYMGYGLNEKCAELFIWDAEVGLEAQITTRYRVET